MKRNKWKREQGRRGSEDTICAIFKESTTKRRGGTAVATDAEGAEMVNDVLY